MGGFKVVTVVPAFNEEKTILKVIGDIKKHSDVIVVDDNSVDNTFNLAKKQNVIVLKNDKNIGYSKSLEVGIFKAISFNYDFAISFDADGQHSSSDLVKIKHFIELDYDLILGNRSNVSRISEKLGKYLFFNTWGMKDPFCGLKCYNLNKVKQFNYFERYESVGVDLALSFIKKKYKFINFNITTSKRKDNSKFGNFMFANYKIFKSIFLTYFYH